MIVLKYEKTGASRFISHIDILKHMERIIRRAEIPVKFSQGFNPHALLFFSPPSVVGVASIAEYIAIDTDLTADETLARYNASVPDTMKATKAFKTEKNPNLQAKVLGAKYIFPVEYKDVAFEDMTIKYSKKGEEVEENISSKVKGVFNADGKLGVTLEMRPDRAAIWLEKQFGKIDVSSIVKIAQYVEGAEVDEWLNALQ